MSILLGSLIVIQAIINLIGALGPEYSFDALWYHLTLPKIYLWYKEILHIDGGLLYYSDMPKLGEMLYSATLALGSETIAKIVHLLFGVGVCVMLYDYARKRYSSVISLCVVLVFYGNLVVAWESTVAYIDLIRTFYEFLSLILFLRWIEEKNNTLFYLSAIFLGFAVTTKLLSLGSLPIFSILTFFVLKEQGNSLISIGKKLFKYGGIVLAIPFPWFMFSFIHTGNPVYPFFTPLYPTHVSLSLFNPVVLVHDLFILFTHAADPISPLYLIFLPCLIFFPKFPKVIKILAIYSLCILVVWYITPRTGGGRFIMAYLPAWSLVIGEVLFIFSKQKSRLYFLTSITIIVLVAISTIFYRGVANSRYIPYLIGKESKETFLINHLNFSFGDFYDINANIAHHITNKDVVLLIGFHNLYYVDFPFIDVSYISPGERFTYIATQHTDLPVQYQFAKKILQEKRTGVTLYQVGEQRWENY